MNTEVTIRQIYALPTLMHWRKEVIEDVFGVVPSKALMVANRQYYRKHMEDGTHIAVVAEVNDADMDYKGVGCGSLCLTEELPSPDNPSGHCAYLMNIYVRSQWRDRGVGHAIVRWLVNRALESGCDKIYLETTDAARSLYKSIGFDELPGIMKYADIHHRKSDD